MEIDAFRLSREEATQWLSSLRVWAENELNGRNGEDE